MDDAGIYRVVASLSHRVTSDQVADALVEEVPIAVGARAVSVFLFDEERDRIRLVRSVGYPADVLDRWCGLPIDDSPLLRDVRRGEPAFAASRLSDPRFDASLSEQFGAGGGFVVPMEAGGRVLGCLAASFDHVRAFELDERRFILTLASHCAQSLERARLFEAERNARAAADAAHRKLQAVLDQLPVAVTIVDRDGRVTLNHEVRSIYGVSFSTANRRDYAAGLIKHADGAPYAEADLPIVRALAGSPVAGEEMLIQSSNGVFRRIRVNAAPVRDDRGEIGSAVAVFSDITEEHRVAEELRASKRRYHAVLRATNDVIWDAEVDTQRIEWNGELERQFGWRPEETNAHPAGGYAWWKEQIHPDDRTPVLRDYEAAIADGAEVWTSEYRFRRADGTYVPTLDRCVFERDATGRLHRVVGALSDVSERHRLLHELRAAVTVRDDFLSIAGHELRTPLAALSAQLLGLKQLPLDEERRAHKIVAAERQVRRLTTLVDELLNVSRIVDGKFQLEREVLDLTQLVADAAARVADDFERNGTRLDVELGPPVVGSWDRLRIDLVVTNLMTNALRYGQKQPVQVRVDSDPRQARIVVEDRGLGILPVDRERIFERFVRAVPNRQFGGLGIGLWLSRHIVHAHGGKLSVESRDGGGSRFIVELPREPS